MALNVTYSGLGVLTGFSGPIGCPDPINQAHTYRKIQTIQSSTGINGKTEIQVIDQGFTIDDCAPLFGGQTYPVTVQNNWSGYLLRVTIRILKIAVLALALGIGAAAVAGLIGYSIVPITTLAIGLGIAAGVCLFAMMIHAWISNSHEKACFDETNKSLRKELNA